MPAHHTVDAIAQPYIELLGALGLRRVVLAGISMGGYVALRMWAREPELIAALVLSNTKAERDSDEIVARRRAQIASIQQHGLAEFIQHRRAETAVAENTRATSRGCSTCITMMNFTVSAEANAATLEAMAAKPDDTATLATIDVPTLITWGSDDAFIPKTSSGVMKDGIRNSSLQVIQDTGHVSNLESPTEYNRILDDFLASLPSPA